MKVSCLPLLMFTLVSALPGNTQAVVNSFGGLLFPADETTIELRELAIRLSQDGERMQVETYYRLHNPDIEKEREIGFFSLPYMPPDRDLGATLVPNIEGLRAELNGEPVGFTAKTIAETKFRQRLKEISELAYIYHCPVRFQSGENSVRLSYSFLPSFDSGGAHGQTYYPFTLTPARLWANRRLDSFSLRVEMKEGSLFTVPRNLGTPAAPNPWEIEGRGRMRLSDGTDSSADELLYVYLNGGSLLLRQTRFAPGRDLMIQMYRPLDHVEPLKSIYWRLHNGKDLTPYSLEELRIARNTLFALHGYRFQSSDLLERFSRYFWYDPDPDVPNSTEILTGEEKTLLRYIMGEERLPGYETVSLRLFLDEFKAAVLRHDWEVVLHYLDEDYLQDRLQQELKGDRRRFLCELFNVDDPQAITGLEFGNFPEQVAAGGVKAQLELEVRSAGRKAAVEHVIRRSGQTFRLIGPHEGVTNYRHRTVSVQSAYGLTVKMSSVGDPYLRCYSTWIEDGAGGYLNLDGSGCDPQGWKSSHCSCPTVSEGKEVYYDLSRYTRIPYSGKVIVAVSSYVGYWRVEVQANH